MSSRHLTPTHRKAAAIVLVGIIAVLAAGWQWGWTPKAGLWTLYSWILLAFAAKDLQERRVPNRWLAVAAPAVLILGVMVGFDSLVSLVAGGLIGLGIGLLAVRLSPQAVGMGDAKLVGLLGLMVGFPGIFLALLAGMIAGGLAALLLLISGRAKRGQTFAYAPYLALGAWLTLFFMFP